MSAACGLVVCDVLCATRWLAYPSDKLAFRGVDLRTRRPAIDAEVTAERELEELLNAQRASISAFANARSPPERWEAPFSDCPFSDFLSSLRLLNTGHDFPCLLLHGLGQPANPEKDSDDLRRLFSPGQHTYVFHPLSRFLLRQSDIRKAYTSMLSGLARLE